MSILRASARGGAFMGVCALLAACGSGTDYLKLHKRDGGPLGDITDAGPAGGGKRDAGNAGGGNGGTHAGDAALDGMPPGATMDAAALALDGATVDLPGGSWILRDGAILLPDGDVIDTDAAVMRYASEIDVSKCQIGSEDTWSTHVDVSDEGGFALVPGRVGFGLVFRAIGSQTCAEKLDVMPIPATQGFGAAHAIFDDCKVIKDVTLVGGEQGWRAAWVDNFTESAELQTAPLDENMRVAAGTKRTTLTKNTSQGERRPVLKQVAGQTIAAWITDNMATGKSRISTRVLDDHSPAVDVVKESAGHDPQSLAFSQIGLNAAALGWVGPDAAPGVWLQKLDQSGAALDKPIQLTSKVGVTSSIDIANRIDGGGVIYSIEIDHIPQIRFRRLDDFGNPESVERTIISPPLLAQGASLATLGGGYAVAYRALPDGHLAAPEIRLTFVTKDGSVMRDANGRLISFHIGDATVANGRTYVAVSVEGEIMVAWIDAGETADSPNLLKVVRRRLDCQ